MRAAVELALSIRGSFVGSRQDTAESLAFAADGKVQADIELQPLSAINQVLGRLKIGAASRVVIDYAAIRSTAVCGNYA